MRRKRDGEHVPEFSLHEVNLLVREFGSMTLRSVGIVMRCSHERVRQLEEAALRKLRQRHGIEREHLLALAVATQAFRDERHTQLMEENGP